MNQSRKILFLILFPVLVYSQSSKVINGTITDGQQALPDVRITNLQSDQVFTTDSKGNYEAKAAIGDYLHFSYNGMKDVKIKIEDVTRFLNFSLYPEANELEEVVVAGRKKSQEYLQNHFWENRDVVRTAYGYVDTRTSAATARIVDLENSNYSYFCIVELLRARFPELRVVGTCTTPEVTITLNRMTSLSNSQSVLFDVDGQVLTQAPASMSVSEIKRIAIFKDLASRTRYGAIGAGGIIVVNTFNTVRGTGSGKKVNKLDKVAERFRLSDDYSDINANPTYLIAMENSDSMEDAKNKYAEFESRYRGFPYFYLDSYSFFYQNGEKEFADALIDENFTELFNDNPVTLKALAYLYQEQLRHEKANKVLKQVFILRPNYAQSYLDLARSFRDLDNPKVSMAMFARYDYLLGENFLERDSIGFEPLINREMNNLIALNRDDFLSDVEKSVRPSLKDSSGATRLVFEWNDSEAEFDLEFLKGNSEHYVWNHTLEQSPDEVLREKNFGYSVAEYLVDKTSDNTPWQVNIKYLGNKSLTPTYLKVTKYTDYGLLSQNKSVKVFKLTTKNIAQKLLQI